MQEAFLFLRTAGLQQSYWLVEECDLVLTAFHFPLQTPVELQLPDWRLPSRLIPIDFGLPRVMKSSFKHLYIRWLKEPLRAYANRS